MRKMKEDIPKCGVIFDSFELINQSLETFITLFYNQLKITERYFSPKFQIMISDKNVNICK